MSAEWELRSASDVLPDGPVIDLDARRKAIAEQWARHPLLHTEEDFDRHLLEFLKGIHRRLKRKMHEEALLALGLDMTAFFYADLIYADELPSVYSASEASASQSDLDPVRIPQATALMADLCVHFLNELAPETAFNDPASANNALRLPLAELVPALSSFVHDVVAIFATTKLTATDRLLFPHTWKILNDNLCLASGYDPDDVPANPRLRMPRDSDLPNIPLVETYLRGTGLCDYLLRPVPFSLPAETRFAGHWIVAPPGRGKTTLLHSMVLDDLAKDACVILMDSKGDLIEPFRNLKDIAGRLIIVDPDPDNPIAINPLDIPKQDLSLAVSHLEYVFSSLLESKMTPLQTVLFRSILRALITAFPNPTLETFRDILTNGIEPYAAYLRKLPQDLQDFFFKEFNTKVYEDRRKEIVWRLRLLLENDTMRAMMLALRTRFNIAEAMDAGKVIILNNSKARLGDQGAEFFGRFFIAQVLAAAQQRAGRKGAEKRPVYFYIDECQNVISKDERIPTILDECRSQKVALILAHQRTEQITSPNVLSALSNCAIRYSNSDDEARFLSSKLRCGPELLQSLKRGQFAAFVRDLTPSAIVLDVPRVDFSNYEQLTPKESAALAAKMQEQYGVLPVAPSPPRSERPRPVEESESPTAPSGPDRTASNDPDTGSHTEESPSW